MLLAEGVYISDDGLAALPMPGLCRKHENASSALSAFHCWVEFTELDAGVLGSELPSGLGGGGVAPVLPSLDVALQRRLVAHPVWQSLPAQAGVAAEGAQLDLGHIQPGAVLGRVVDLEESMQNGGGLGGRGRVRAHGMRGSRWRSWCGE